MSASDLWLVVALLVVLLGVLLHIREWRLEREEMRREREINHE